jgi:hypothetical protein
VALSYTGGGNDDSRLQRPEMGAFQFQKENPLSSPFLLVLALNPKEAIIKQKERGMDLERATNLHNARNEFIEAANQDLPEAKKGVVEELKARYIAVTEKMAKYVKHTHYESNKDSGHREQHSAARFVRKLDGPMPDMFVRFRYYYKHEADGVSFTSAGISANEHGERISHIEVEWFHSPSGVDSEPNNETEDMPIDTRIGEVIATESLSFGDIRILKNEALDNTGMENLQGSHPSVRLALIEQSMDQYEACSPSVYELSEGIVQG